LGGGHAVFARGEGEERKRKGRKEKEKKRKEEGKDYRIMESFRMHTGTVGGEFIWEERKIGRIYIFGRS
jgi:hypothetical protein